MSLFKNLVYSGFVFCLLAIGPAVAFGQPEANSRATWGLPIGKNTG